MAVLRDARKSALLWTRFTDDIDMISNLGNDGLVAPWWLQSQLGARGNAELPIRRP